MLGTAFSASTNPTSTQVELLINYAEDEIDQKTNHAWRAITITKEHHTLGERYLTYTGVPVYLDHRTITAFSSAGGDKIEVWDGASWVDWLATKTEGRDKDFWVDYENGIIYLKTFLKIPNQVRVTYRFGESAVPKDIEQAATLLTVISLVLMEGRANLLPEGTSQQVNYTDKIKVWRERVDEILHNRKEMYTPDILQ